MAWVTKSSEEQYEPAPPPREYSRQEKASNWWHYNKGILAAVVIVVVIVAWVLHDALFRVQPDLQVGYVGSSTLPEETVQALEEALLPYCTDSNGDGRVVVQVNQYQVDFQQSGSSSDLDSNPYAQLAGTTQLTGALDTSSDVYLFLLEDPAAFEAQTLALQYTDGSLPAEEDAGNWQQMVYRWADCPVLTALDLGSYTRQTAEGATQASGQELLRSLYLGFRGNWTQEAPESRAASLAVWTSLTAGATAPAGEG